MTTMHYNFKSMQKVIFYRSLPVDEVLTKDRQRMHVFVEEMTYMCVQSKVVDFFFTNRCCK